MWVLDGDRSHSHLLRYALTEQGYSNTLVMLTVSMTTPWAMLDQLREWASILQDHIDKLPFSAEAIREYQHKCMDIIISSIGFIFIVFINILCFYRCEAMARLCRARRRARDRAAAPNISACRRWRWRYRPLTASTRRCPHTQSWPRYCRSCHQGSTFYPSYRLDLPFLNRFFFFFREPDGLHGDSWKGHGLQRGTFWLYPTAFTQVLPPVWCCSVLHVCKRGQELRFAVQIFSSPDIRSRLPYPSPCRWERRSVHVRSISHFAVRIVYNISSSQQSGRLGQWEEN